MAAKSGKPLILVDGSSYLFRAYHALPPLANSRGEATGAVYGVANMLRKLLADYDPEHLAVVFDAKGPTFRDDIYEAYKANRPPMPEDLAEQIEPLHRLVEALGLPVLCVSGVEADDVIGTLAERASRQGWPTLISTGDKDLAQLVNDEITLINTMTGTVLDHQGVIDKFGVPPERMIDYLALVGDTSDNIPGVPGVGPKTAAKLLNEYGSLNELLANADAVGGKVGERLREHREDIELGRKLATIRRDVVLDREPAELRRGEADSAALRPLLERLEFGRWLEQLPRSDVAEAPGAHYQAVLDKGTLEAWIKRLRASDLVAVDTETTSLDYMDARVVGVSFAVEVGEAAYCPFGHDYPDAPAQLDRDEVLAQLGPLLVDPKLPKLGHNLKYDISVLANHGIEIAGARHDTMLQSYVLNSTATRHDLDSLARKYLSREVTSYETVAGKGAKQVTFDQVPLAEATPYAAEDADVTLALHQVLWPRLCESDGLRRVYDEIEMPLVPVLSRMERTGVLVDAALLRRQSAELQERMAAIEAQAHEAAGTSFNLGSPKQIQEVLYGQLQLPVRHRTPKGQPSTAEETLQELAEEYALPQLILEHRALSKLRSTYTERLPEQVNPRTGRVHTSFHQAVAATGRLSSSEPNLQNIPVRSAAGRRIRQAFVAPSGCRVMAADYSQIELRIMAHLSDDPGLCDAFARGEDIHRATAADVFNVALDQVTAEQRRGAKAINFGLIYGMSAFGLARQLGIERREAEAYVERYFNRYPGVHAFMERTREAAREQGYVETLFGRRLYVPEINARNVNRQRAAERTAINAPMQGSAADIIKQAMIAVDRWLQAGETGARMIMQVHDELVFEVPETAVEATREAVVTAMSGVAELAVPLEVEVGVGRNWDEAH